MGRVERFRQNAMARFGSTEMAEVINLHDASSRDGGLTQERVPPSSLGVETPTVVRRLAEKAGAVPKTPFPLRRAIGEMGREFVRRMAPLRSVSQTVSQGIGALTDRPSQEATVSVSRTRRPQPRANISSSTVRGSASGETSFKNPRRVSARRMPVNRARIAPSGLSGMEGQVPITGIRPEDAGPDNE